MFYENFQFRVGNRVISSSHSKRKLTASDNAIVTCAYKEDGMFLYCVCYGKGTNRRADIFREHELQVLTK